MSKNPVKKDISLRHLSRIAVEVILEAVRNQSLCDLWRRETLRGHYLAGPALVVSLQHPSRACNC